MTIFSSGQQRWLDQNILLVLSAVLLAFIPLYPKLPLFDIIPGYIVRVRIEDFLIFFAVVVWIIQLYRKKITWKAELTPFIGAYAVAGLLSTLSAIIITRTVPFDIFHVGKTLLHYFRYLEYFSLFFITYSAVRSKKDLKLLLGILVATLVGVFIYGVGQRYFYWPVYSTMNREFSKGIRLILTEHARVQSTFAGHYDLAAYLVIVLPFISAWAFITQKTILKLGLWLVFLSGLWLLMMTASRSSLLGYMTGICMVLVLTALVQTNWKNKITWFISRSTWIGVITLVMLASFGSSMYERLLQSLEAFPALNTAYHAVNSQRKIFIQETLPQAIGLNELPNFKMNMQVERPENSVSVDALEGVMVSSDQRPVPAKPSDVKVDVPDYKKVATISADGTVEIITIEVPRTFSETALNQGLSVAIRYDTLWPRALQGFYTNPVFGTGYATLTKDEVYQFTEAESTDNNFLRILGETGLAGFITFFSIITFAIWKSGNSLLRFAQSNDQNLTRFLSIGYISATMGLLANAIYIDVFAASKVAQIYWALTGIVLASYPFLFATASTAPTKKTTNKSRKTRNRTK